MKAIRCIFIRSIVTSSLALALAACGAKGAGPGAGGPPGGGTSKSTQPRSGNATAEEVAEEMRGDVRCPARIETRPRDAKAPVDDVLGVRPGMTYEEAANLVLCSNELMVVQADGRGFQIQTYGETLRQGFSARLAQPRVEKTSKQIMMEMQDYTIGRSGNRVSEDMKPGESKWYVGTIGLPGKERVINVAREEWFAAGRNPTMESVEQALLKKYGAKPTRNQHWGGGSVAITWAYDPMGRLISETSPLYNSCTGVSSPDGGGNFSPDCGIVVMGVVYPRKDNAELGQMVQVGVINQAGGYEGLQAVEQTLQAQDAQRRAQQVKDAQNADVPDL